MGMLKKLMQRPAFWIVLFLASNDLLVALFLLGSRDAVKSSEEGPLCQTQAFALGYFNLCSTMWSCVGTSYYFYAVQLATTNDNTISLPQLKLIFVRCVLWCQCVPLIPSLLPFVFDAYGYSVAWCWIKSDRNQRLALIQWFSYYFVGWIGVMYCARTFYYIRQKHYRESTTIMAPSDPSAMLATPLSQTPQEVWLSPVTSPGARTSPEKLQQKFLIYYPVAAIICVVIGTIYRIYQHFNDPPKAMDITNIIIITMRMAYNAFVFACNPKVQSTLRSYCRRTCPRKGSGGYSPSTSEGTRERKTRSAHWFPKMTPKISQARTNDRRTHLESGGVGWAEENSYGYTRTSAGGHHRHISINVDGVSAVGSRVVHSDSRELAFSSVGVDRRPAADNEQKWAPKNMTILE
mmetsp:Transcript_11213/g.21511  ORF Transcript_11213/g.21511 Transcript_11213/m.21511 type:complete len:406 (-) Transcript_11213:17-1234(-)